MAAVTSRRTQRSARREPHAHTVGRAPSWLRLLVALSFFGVAVLVPTLPQNLAIVDIVIALVIWLGLLSMTRTTSPATGLLVRCSPWILLIVLGSLGGLVGVGLPLWAVSTLARLILALAAFFVFYHLLLRSPSLMRSAMTGTWLGWGLTSVAILALPAIGPRASGFFYNPNYAASYLLMASIVLVWQSRRASVRAGVVLLTFAAWFATASFGALIGAGIVLVALVIRYAGRATVGLLLVGVSLLSLGVLLVGVAPEEPDTGQGDEIAESEEFELTVGLSSRRFDRSRDTRLDLWSRSITIWLDQPLGVGPGGSTNRAIVVDGQEMVQGIRAHVDVITFLFERGPLGVAGLVGLWVVLWRRSAPRGLARLLIISVIVQGLFRDTMHFRHVWLLLALAMAIDLHARSDDDQPDSDAELGPQRSEPLPGV